MKKITLLMLALMLCCFTASAITVEEVIGNWSSKEVNVKTGQRELKVGVSFDFDFAENGMTDAKISTRTRVVMEPGKYFEYMTFVTFQGKYEVAGDSISIMPDIKTMKVDMPDDEMSIVGIDDPQVESQLRSQFDQARKQTSEFDVSSELSNIDDEKPMVLNNVMIIGKKMAATLDDEKLSFSRKKKK